MGKILQRNKKHAIVHITHGNIFILTSRKKCITESERFNLMSLDTIQNTEYKLENIIDGSQQSELLKSSDKNKNQLVEEPDY